MSSVDASNLIFCVSRDVTANYAPFKPLSQVTGAHHLYLPAHSLPQRAHSIPDTHQNVLFTDVIYGGKSQYDATRSSDLRSTSAFLRRGGGGEHLFLRHSYVSRPAVVIRRRSLSLSHFPFHCFSPSLIETTRISYSIVTKMTK